MMKQLEKIVQKESIDFDRDVLFAIAKSSDGSLRDAESVLDQLVSFSREKVTLQDVVSLLGLVEEEVKFALADTIIRKDTRSTLALLNEIIDSGKDLGVFLTELIGHFRNLMVAKLTQADPELIDLPAEICARLLEQAKAFSLEEIFSTFNILVNTQEMAKRLDSLRIPLEISLVKLTHAKLEAAQPYIPPRPLPKAEKPDTPAQMEDVDPPPAPPDTQAASLEQVRAVWDEVVSAVGSVKMSVATYLNEASAVKLVNNILTLSLPKNCSLHKESLERKEHKAVIEKILSEVLKVPLRVSFILSQEAAPAEEAQGNPFIKSALETFKGRVIRQ
jgi:DNA polymerase-3 subunit gamma/tau